MQWIKNYRLFLFDFDGLLVNTEELHFKAYKRICADRGHDLQWDFQDFSTAAHHTSTGLRDHIYADLPSLEIQEPSWQVLYSEKKQAFERMLEEGQVSLMPGAAELIKSLNEEKINCCVVTNSPLSVISVIRRQNPLLNLIPHWITRENYSRPKPDPECYLNAIKTFSKPGDPIIGFEDSPKGYAALCLTAAVPVLICPSDSPYLAAMLKSSVKYYPSFDKITDADHP